MEITVAKADRLSGIAEIEKLCFTEPWSEKALEMFDGGTAFAVVLSNDEKVLSYCTVVTVLDEAQIINVATRPEQRWKGYAGKVMERVLSECLLRKINSVSLEVRKSNIPAITLYGKYGFSIVGERKDFYKNPRENACVMIKNL